MKKYKLIFFETQNKKPVKEFMLSLNKPTIAKSLRLFDLLEEHGAFIGMPYVKKITKELYELRIRGQEEIRFLFALENNNIHILHGFKKKKQKIPKKEIETAEKRLTNI